MGLEGSLKVPKMLTQKKRLRLEMAQHQSILHSRRGFSSQPTMAAYITLIPRDPVPCLASVGIGLHTAYLNTGR